MSNVSVTPLLEHFKKDLLSLKVVYQRRKVVIIEICEEVEGNAFNAGDTYNPPNATATTREENLNQPVQMADQDGITTEGNQLVIRALKQTSRNGMKCLRTRQETQSAINLGKTAKAVIKQMRTQERLGGKGKIKV